ncbi:Dual adapter for phosphotyrosine and 3-phosphotyrosine and 3-phosphoinositide, partial [Galemys pyrenaicus]
GIYRKKHEVLTGQAQLRRSCPSSARPRPAPGRRRLQIRFGTAVLATPDGAAGGFPPTNPLPTRTETAAGGEGGGGRPETHPGAPRNAPGRRDPGQTPRTPSRRPGAASRRGFPAPSAAAGGVVLGAGPSRPPARGRARSDAATCLPALTALAAVRGARPSADTGRGLRRRGPGLPARPPTGAGPRGRRDGLRAGRGSVRLGRAAAGLSPAGLRWPTLAHTRAGAPRGVLASALRPPARRAAPSGRAGRGSPHGASAVHRLVLRRGRAPSRTHLGAACPGPAHPGGLSCWALQARPAAKWYHGGLSRHAAEALLLSNGQQGSYLLRDSREQAGLYSLSVRAKESVKHFHVEYTGYSFKFGFDEFSSLKHFVEHFANQPLIGSETGALIVLKHPYPRAVEEPSIYESVRVHTAMQTGRTERDLVPAAPSLGTKEGYLTKQGGLVKTWKTRWFTLQRNELKYFKDQMAGPVHSTPLKPARWRQGARRSAGEGQARRELAVTGVVFSFSQVTRADSDPRPHRVLVFPFRTFYLCAKTGVEADEWIKILRWKMVSSGREHTPTGRRQAGSAGALARSGGAAALALAASPASPRPRAIQAGWGGHLRQAGRRAAALLHRKPRWVSRR